MRSASGDCSLRAAVHHRSTLFPNLQMRLFSAIRREKRCTHASPKSIESSVPTPSTLSPSTTAAKDPWVQTVLPVESNVVPNTCTMSAGKDKFQHFVRITVSSRLSSLRKSVGKRTPPVRSYLENDSLPYRQRKLASRPSSSIKGSFVSLKESKREKYYSNHSVSSGLSDPFPGIDLPPDYTTVMPESQGPEKDQAALHKNAVATEVIQHDVSLDTTPTCNVVHQNCVVERTIRKGSQNEDVDDHTIYPTGETRLDPEVTPNSTHTHVFSSISTNELRVSKVLRKPVVESNFLHFYSTLEPYIVQHELPSRFVEKTLSPIDNGPLPESDGFRVIEGPFTTPAGGTSAPQIQEPPPPPAPPPMSTDLASPHKKKSEIKYTDPCPNPVIAAPSDSTRHQFHQLVSKPITPVKLNEMLGKIMTWDLETLHASTSFSQPLNSTLRSMQNKWQILAFDLAFETSDASAFRDNYGFGSKPLALQLPCPSTRITELGDVNGPALHTATGQIQSHNGGPSGSGSTHAREGSGSSTYFKQSESSRMPRGKKRANDNDDDDRKGKKKERREEPPAGGDPPPPPDLENTSVPCPYWSRDPNSCRNKSCRLPKKNLSKLKEHLRRVHVLHLACPFGDCIFYAGDKYQIKRHQKTAHPDHPEMEPIPRTAGFAHRKMHQDLEVRNLSWEQISEICFRVELEEQVAEPIDGADGFEDGDQEEDEVEERDDDNEEHEEYDDHEVHEEYADAVGGDGREELIPISPFEATLSMISDGAPTILDTPQTPPGNYEGLPMDPFVSPLSDLLADLRQNEQGSLPTPAPDLANSTSFLNPGDGAPRGAIQEYISLKFKKFSETYLEGLEKRHGILPRTAEQMAYVLSDIDRLFADIGERAGLSLTVPNGGSGPVAYAARDTFTYSAPVGSSNTIPLNFPMHQMMFPDPMGFPYGGNNSNLPSLTQDSQSSHNSIPYYTHPNLFQGDMSFPRFQPAMPSGSQPMDSGMLGPQGGGRAIPNHYRDYRMHKDLDSDFLPVDGGPDLQSYSFGQEDS
ncbi:hypothetical protein L873DRAFT_1802197 [Choiromyces venosus 120613-1]|uniref:Uncharacterized protein n=1 Tax=Choiromyces venosus 120613-1 TaxID=1336337 RepID=A0A3N4JV81_9PEZI|nr:hypothetical protein L873DRAFT_1802197 [Choiromyces venosus 120613-1]